MHFKSSNSPMGRVLSVLLLVTPRFISWHGDDGWWHAIFYVFLLAQNIQCPQISSSSQINIHNDLTLATAVHKNIFWPIPIVSSDKRFPKNVARFFRLTFLIVNTWKVFYVWDDTTKIYLGCINPYLEKKPVTVYLESLAA